MLVTVSVQCGAPDPAEREWATADKLNREKMGSAP